MPPNEDPLDVSQYVAKVVDGKANSLAAQETEGACAIHDYHETLTCQTKEGRTTIG